MAVKKIVPAKPAIRINKVEIVSNDSDGLVVRFPHAAAEYLKLHDDDTDLFAIPTAGVIQLASEVPSLAVPVSTELEDAFASH